MKVLIGEPVIGLHSDHAGKECLVNLGSSGDELALGVVLAWINHQIFQVLVLFAVFVLKVEEILLV